MVGLDRSIAPYLVAWVLAQSAALVVRAAAVHGAVACSPYFEWEADLMREEACLGWDSGLTVPLAGDMCIDLPLRKGEIGWNNYNYLTGHYFDLRSART